MSGDVESSQAGQMLDADIYFNPSNSPQAFATPAAQEQNPESFDLKTVLAHEWAKLLAYTTRADGERFARSCGLLTETLSGPSLAFKPQP